MTIVVRHPADRWSVLRALATPLLMLVPFVHPPDTATGQALLWLLIWLAIQKLNYVLHNHVHQPLTTSRRLNRAIDLGLGFCTGMTAGNWRLTHLHAHHCQHPRDRLPSRRPFFHADPAGLLARPSFLNGVRHALETMWPQWWAPLRESIRRGLLAPPGFRRPYYRRVLGEYVAVHAPAVALAILDPTVALVYLLLPYAIVYFFSRYVDYITHAGGDEADPVAFANNCVAAGYNRRFWNFGYHAAHHLRPSLHWTRLPAAHAALVAGPGGERARVTGHSFAGLASGLWLDGFLKHAAAVPTTAGAGLRAAG